MTTTRTKKKRIKAEKTLEKIEKKVLEKTPDGQYFTTDKQCLDYWERTGNKPLALRGRSTWVRLNLEKPNTMFASDRSDFSVVRSTSYLVNVMSEPHNWALNPDWNGKENPENITPEFGCQAKPATELLGAFRAELKQAMDKLATSKEVYDY